MSIENDWVVQITLANGGVINNIVKANPLHDKEDLAQAYKEKLNSGQVFNDFNTKIVNVNHIVHLDIINYDEVDFYEDDEPIGFDH